MPSQAAKVNESAPAYPAFGMNVAVVPLSATVPCAGWETMRRLRVFWFGSEALSWMLTGVPDAVDAEALDTTGGEFGLADSLEGPSWQL